MSSISVQALRDTRDPRLLGLFERVSSPSLLGYHHPRYGELLDAVLGDEGVWLLALDAGEPVGFLPLRQRPGPVGRVVNALPFFGPNGGVLVADGAEPAPVEAALLGAFRAHVGQPDVAAAAFYTPFLADADRLAAALAPDETVPKFTQALDLTRAGGWPRRRRRDLQRVERAGVTVRAAEPGDGDALWRAYRASCLHASLPEKPEPYLRGLLDLALAAPRAPVHFAVAQREGQVVAGLVTLWGPVTLSYAVPFALPEERSHQPGTLLVDAVARDARARGLRWLNFESSPRRGDSVYEYKRQWGAELRRYAVLCFYPNGREKLDALSDGALRGAYPHYFVRPMGIVSGTLEAENGRESDVELG
jgi:hypothetical protein